MTATKLALCSVILLAASISIAQQSTDTDAFFQSLSWGPGPGTYDLTRRATIALPSGFDRLDASDTKTLMEFYQNPTAGDEYYVAPEDMRWFSVFSYEQTGHVKDNEEIDADALLKSIRMNTDSGNRERRKRGWAEMHIVGWQYKPFYDENTNRLSWAILGESEGQEIVNFNTRLLGRTGVISATLVAQPALLDASIKEFEELLGGFQYNIGDAYAEYRAGDKLATYGLAALVTGGAAAAVAKGAGKGLFKAIGLGIVAVFAFVGSAIKRLFSRRTSA